MTESQERLAELLEHEGWEDYENFVLDYAKERVHALIYLVQPAALEGARGALEALYIAVAEPYRRTGQPVPKRVAEVFGK